MAEAETLYRNFYQDHAALIRSVVDLGHPLPQRFRMAVDFILNSDLRKELSADRPDPDRITELLEEVRRTGIALDTVTLEFAFRKTLERLAERFADHPLDETLTEYLDNLVGIGVTLPFQVHLWQAQNACCGALEAHYAAMREKASGGEVTAERWLAHLRSLAGRLRIRAG